MPYRATYPDSGQKINTHVPFVCAAALGQELEADGWKSPDTYGREFDEAGAFPAVYVFEAVDIDACFRRAFIAYVGQSKNLEQRWSGHPILAELEHPNIFVKRWFKPTPQKLLRSAELELIQRFYPPWNVQGRKRGVSFA